MRVISGTYKGRALNTKKGNSTRPTLDRCKETLINILRPRLNGTSCLDLFSGSGQIGIEFLSNGAESCVFVDNDRLAVEVIKSNLSLLGVQQKVVCCDYRIALKEIERQSIDIIFVDPPFSDSIYQQILFSICDSQILTSNGVVICESNAELADEISTLKRFRQKRIGSVYFSFYEKSEVIK